MSIKLKKIITLIGKNFKSIVKRSLSTRTELYSLERKSEEYAILKLHKSPVNSLNLEYLNLINEQFDKLEYDEKLKGVILSSDIKNVFSAGVDILEMYNCEAKRLETFWRAVQDFWLKLYGSKKVYIAALNGHALAFGCVIAMSCDYRIMINTDSTKIGLTAVLLGINAPFWFKNTMINTIGFRETEKCLQFAKIYNPHQALNVGLVDEITTNENLIQKSEELMKTWCKLPNSARGLTKQTIRAETIEKLLSRREEDVQEFIRSTMDPILQKNLEKYLANLKKK